MNEAHAADNSISIPSWAIETGSATPPEWAFDVVILGFGGIMTVSIGLIGFIGTRTINRVSVLESKMANQITREEFEKHIDRVVGQIQKNHDESEERRDQARLEHTGKFQLVEDEVKAIRKEIGSYRERMGKIEGAFEEQRQGRGCNPAPISRG